MQLLLRIILVIPVGYIAACLAAGLFFVVATISSGADLSVYTGETLLLAAWTAAWAGALAAVPATLAVFAAEVFGWRSLLFYLVAGGAIGLCVELAFSPLPLTGVDAQLLLASGSVAGAVYWLLAGRSAGILRSAASSG
jgi:hypothetical protein